MTARQRTHVASAAAWVAAAEADLGEDWDRWARNCHSASLRLVQSGLLPAGSRVARGWCEHVPGSQHSWVVVNLGGDALADPYAEDVLILDPTAWSYQEGEASVPAVWVSDGRGYDPHGAVGPRLAPGALPRPADYSAIVQPDPVAYAALSGEAMLTLALVGGLDVAGWMALVRCDVRTYPAAEIVRLMQATPRLRALVPIDLRGMLTAENPGGLYF